MSHIRLQFVLDAVSNCSPVELKATDVMAPALEWWSVLMHTPLERSQNFTVLSFEPLATRLPRTLKMVEVTEPVCP
jgi:hypothetical protein